MKPTIIYYSKKGCQPCEFYFNIFTKKIKAGKYQKITLETDYEALKTVQMFNTRFVPFVVINENSVIHSEDLKTLLFAIKNT